MNIAPIGARPVSLADVLDRVIDKGAAVNADVLLGLADVDLIRVALRLVIAPADRFDDLSSAPAPPAPPPAGPRRTEAPGARSEAVPLPAQPEAAPAPAAPGAVSGPSPQAATDRQGLDRGLAQLVLTLVELLRELMDRQAVRRAMRGTLNDDEAERLGTALLELDGRMDELVASFGLDRSDLNLDLGPLGDLL